MDLFKLNKGLPFQNEAEQSVIGAILTEPLFVIPQTLGYLTPDDFYQPTHRAIFNAMSKIHKRGEPIDAVTLTKELKGHVSHDCWGYLAVLVEQLATTANVKYYVRILRAETERRRRILKATEEIESAYTGESTVSRGYVRLAEVLETVMEESYMTSSAGRMSGYETGFPTLDGFLGGLQKGELYIVAGRPSQGKSTLCTQIANHVYRMGARVAYFPLEAGYKAQARNIAAMDTQTEVWKLRTGKGLNQTPEQTDALLEYLNIQRAGVFNMSLAKTSKGVESVLREMVSEHNGLDVVVVDHLQEMQAEKNDYFGKRHLQLENILQDLRRMAREFQIPVILAAQVGRAAEGREPTLAEIKDSGSIEQIADVVMIIHGAQRGSGSRIVNVAKNRNGATGKVALFLNGEILRFEENNQV